MKRTGLQKVECLDCRLGVYMTVAQLERGDMPESCWKCSGFMAPAHWDLAGDLWEAGKLGEAAYRLHPMTVEFERQVNSVYHGQASHGIKGRKLRPAEEIAEERTRKGFAQTRKARQLSGLVQFAREAQLAAEMPF